MAEEITGSSFTYDPQIDPETRLKIESLVEAYEMEIRRQLDLTKGEGFEELESKIGSFRKRAIANELKDLHRDIKEIREEEKTIIGFNF
jgi:glycine betaine transporter